MDQTQLQWLINEGDKLFEKVGNESFFTSEKPAYEFWLNSAIDFVGRYKIGSTNPLKIYNPNMWRRRYSSKPYVHYGGDVTVVYASNTQDQKQTYSVMDFSNLFEKQINFLREIEYKEDEKLKKQKFIEIHTNGSIFYNENSYKYKPSDKKFKMILILIRKGNYINTSILIKQTGHKSVGTLTKEKREINRRFFEKFQIRDFIKGQKNSGYTINPEYLEFTQITK